MAESEINTGNTGSNGDLFAQASRAINEAAQLAESKDVGWFDRFEALGPSPSPQDCLQLAQSAPVPVLQGWLLGFASATL